jgi:hypothetical protein
VTASDVKAIEDLRRDEQAAAAVDVVQKVQRFGRVEEGQPCSSPVPLSRGGWWSM